MKMLPRSLMVALVAFPLSCARPATETEKKKTPQAATQKPNTPKEQQKTIDVPANWPRGVAAAYRQLHGLGPAQAGQALKAILKLAKSGGAAEEALARVSNHAKIPERVRAMAGVMVVRLHRYDRKGLKAQLGNENQFAAREAVSLLAELGGADAAAALDKVAKERSELAVYARAKLANLAKQPLPPRAEELLQRLLADTDAEKKKWAATALSVEFPTISERPLMTMQRMVVADRDTQMQAALALVMANKKKLEKLESFARPGNTRYLRYAAFDELMQLGAPGRAVVERFANRPGEKMRSHLRRLLAKK